MSDENEHRKPLTAGEMVRRGKRLEELERPASEERKSPGHNQHTEVEGKFPSTSKGQTRDKVGKVLGVSGKTYEKAKAIAEKGIETNGVSIAGTSR